MYGVSVSPELISRVIDAVVEELQDWQKRPLDAVYPVAFLDAIRVRTRDEGMVRNKVVHVALGIRHDGSKEVRILRNWDDRAFSASAIHPFQRFI